MSPDTGRSQRRKRGGWIIMAIVAFGTFGVGWYMWQIAEQKVEVATGATGGAADEGARDRMIVTSEPLRTSQGFQVVTLTDRDLAEQPVLADLFSGGHGRAILAPEEYDALTGFLVSKMPDGWDDPYEYGVAWRSGTQVVRLSAARAG